VSVDPQQGDAHVDRTGHPAPPIVPEGEHNDLGEPERPGEYGRVGYGQAGRYTPLLLGIAIVVVVLVIGLLQVL
jgi:hypothetical protein